MTHLEAKLEAERRYGKRAVLWQDRKGKLFAIYVKRLSGNQALKGVGDSWAAAFLDADRRESEQSV